MITLKQPIHYLKVKHRTCSTATGRRRSPMAGPSYDSGIALLDETTGRITNRQHTDGTEIIFTEIFSADSDCKYSDKSIPIQDRLNRLWNDLYALNKNDNERIAVYGEIALPNGISDNEMKELTNNLGEFLATAYNRPFQLSAHKKKGNYHIHFSGAEREWKNGKFQNKRQKFYKDLNDNLILDKNYKDKNGWDIRKPIIDNDKVPAGKNPFERDKITGNYLYQKLGERNRKLWASDTRSGKFLEKDQLAELHNKIDEVINQFLIEHEYFTMVKRNPKSITEDLKKLNATTIRIPTKDYKINSERAQEIRKQNEKNNIIKTALTENMINQKLAKIDIIDAKKDKEKSLDLLDLKIQELQEAEKELKATEQAYLIAEQECQKALDAQNESLPKIFRFTGTEQDKIKSFVKFFNNAVSSQTDENLEFLDAVSAERDNYKNIVVESVLPKLSQNDLNNILKDATKKDMESGNFAKAYLSRRKSVLQKFAEKYGEKDKFDLYDRWSNYAQQFYKKIHSKDNQKSAQRDHTGNQIDGR